MIPSGGARERQTFAVQVLAVQYLRAVAASLVVVYHVLEQITPVARHDDFAIYAFSFGVDIFFVISGFIIWTSTARRPIGPVDFWIVRLVRIVPLYWLALATALVMIALRNGS